jgi:hypothetical protein
MNAEDRIEKKTVKAIHAAKSHLLLPEIVYRGVLKKRYEAHTSKDLSEAQGKDLVRYFNDIKSRSNRAGLTCSLCMPRTKETGTIPGDTVFPVSPEQLIIIEALKEAIEWQHQDGFSRWLLKYFALTEIEYSPQASVVINALKKLLKSQHHCSSCTRSPEKNGGKNGR